jgi:hypothetical protein
MQVVSPLLDSLYRDLGISERIKLDNIRRNWHDIFSGPLAEHTSPSDLKDGLLSIAVDSPAWLQHLKFLKKEILTKLKSHGVKDIRFKYGNIRQDRESGKSGKSQDEVIFREMTKEESSGIENALTEIEDAELQDAVRQVLEKSVRRKRL